MRTVTGRVNNAKPIALSKAAALLSGFDSSETQASQDVSAYLRRASAAFTELRSVHREIRSTKPNSEARNLKVVDDLVENESVKGEELVHGRKQDKKKKKKKVKENKEEDLVEDQLMVKLEDEQERKKKRKNENVIDDKLEEERTSKNKEEIIKGLEKTL